jgi:mannosyltransferase
LSSTTFRWAGLLAVLTFCVNLIGLGAPAAWRDEAATWVANQRSVPDLLSMLRHVDAVHGTYYLLMRAWQALFGDSIVSLRMLSVVAVAVGAGLATLLAAELFGPAAAPWCGLLYGIVPPLTWAAGEARSSALSAALVTAAMLAFWIAVRRRRWWNWAVYALTATASVYVFFYSALAFVGLSVVLMWLPARIRLPSILATASAAVASLPIVLVAIGETDQVSWLQKYRFGVRQVIAVAFWGRVDWAGWLGAALLVAALAFACWCLRSPDLRGRLAGVLGWLLVPSLVLLATTAFTPVYHPRYVTFSVPALALLLGFAISRLSGWRQWLALALVVTACAPSFLVNRSPHGKVTAGPAVAELARQSQPGDGLYIVRFDRHALDWAFPGQLPNLTNIGADTVSGWRSRTLKWPSLAVPKIADRLAGHARVWIFADHETRLSPTEQAFSLFGYRAVQTIHVTNGYPVTLVLMVRAP